MVDGFADVAVRPTATDPFEADGWVGALVPVVDGPVVDGPVVGGPVLGGAVLAGPVLDGPVLAGPVPAGLVPAGPELAGLVSAGPVLTGPAVGRVVARPGATLPLAEGPEPSSADEVCEAGVDPVWEVVLMETLAWAGVVEALGCRERGEDRGAGGTLALLERGDAACARTASGETLGLAPDPNAQASTLPGLGE